MTALFRRRQNRFANTDSRCSVCWGEECGSRMQSFSASERRRFGWPDFVRGKSFGRVEGIPRSAIEEGEGTDSAGWVPVYRPTLPLWTWRVSLSLYGCRGHDARSQAFQARVGGKSRRAGLEVRPPGRRVMTPVRCFSYPGQTDLSVLRIWPRPWPLTSCPFPRPATCPTHFVRRERRAIL